MVCIQNSSLLVYSKSQKVSASYYLPFQHSRGKNQPVCGFRPPPGLFRVKVKFFRHSYQLLIAYQSYKGVLNYRVIRITLRLCAGSAREIPAHMRVLGLMSPMRFINPIAKFQSSHFGLITHSG